MKARLLFFSGVALGAMLLLAGCSTNPKPAFAELEKMAAARTGHNARWTRDSAEAAEVRSAVQSLLQTNLTAENAVQIALVNNPRLQTLFEEIGIAKADLVQAGLLRNPRFGGFWRFPDQPPSGLNSEYSIAADFLDLIVLPLRKKIAARNLEATKLRVTDEVLRLAAEVKSAFYTVQAREQLVKRLQIIVEVNEAAADVATRQHEAGNITDLEFADQKAIYAQSRVTLAETQKESRADRERLNRFLGFWGNETAWRVAGELPPLPEKEIPFEKLESLAISQRLDLAASRAQLANVAAALSLRTKTRFVPILVEAGVNTEKETDGQRVTGPTLNLELPIFDQGQAAIAKLAAQYRQAQRGLEALAIDARSQVRESRDRLIANRDLAEYYQKILLPLRIQIVNQTLLQYNAMQKGPLDLLLAKERELQAERGYVEAWRDYWISRADLEKAVGGKLTGKSSASEKMAEKPESKQQREHPHEKH